MMIFLNKQACAALVLSLLMVTTGYARGNEPVKAHIYRYKDAEGNLHIGRQIPPENYRFGYTALDEFGEVIEVVPPAPTAEERAAFEAKLDREKRVQHMRARDDQLLKAYSSASGAENARDRKLAQIDVVINITQAKIAAMRVNYDREVEYAADMERDGKVPDSRILKNMADIEETMLKMSAHIEQKEEEKLKVVAEFEPIIIRLQQIEAKRNAARAK